MFILYNFLMTILAPIWVPWMLLKAKRRKEQPNWKERQGDYPFTPRKDGERIWIHAVSVGEVVAVVPILRELRQLLPNHEIVLSVTTSSGHQTARELQNPLSRPGGEGAGALFDHLVYLPLDVPRFQLAAMQRVRPSVVAIMETELWFNFLWAAKTFDAKILLINGRISDRSYPRARFLRFFYSRLLSMVDRCLMQTEKDADRIRALGATEVQVLGNCKFDQAAEGLDANPAEWRTKLGIPADAFVIVVGSTRGEEEEMFVLDSLAPLISQQSDIQNPKSEISVVHAPRHLERVPGLSREIERRFGAFALRSKGETGRYLILDTYGELSQVYSVADVVIIGGGFANLGGQNLLQALAHGKPVLHGPHMQNFREVTKAADDSGAALSCPTPESLRASVTTLLDEGIRETMGAAARQLVQSNLGASGRYAKAIAASTKSDPSDKSDASDPSAIRLSNLPK